MNCEQFLDSISEYLDGALEPELAAQAQSHSLECRSCQAVLASSRLMLKWAQAFETFAMPSDVQLRLHERLRQFETETRRVNAAAGAAAPEPAELAPLSLETAGSARRKGRLSWLRPDMFRIRTVAWAALILLLVGFGVHHYQAGASTVSGWLIDGHCYTDFRGHPADHTRACLLRCVQHGYGLGLVNAKGKFLPFDARGNRSARAAIMATNKKSHLWVTVKVKRTNQDTLDVERLALTSPPAPPN